MKDLTEGNIYKSFILYTIPVVLAGVLSQAFNLVDTVIAGQFLGEHGIASIGATSSYVTLVSSLLWGAHGGIGIFCARLFGSREYGKIKNCLIFYFLLSSVTILAVGGLSILFYRPIFSFLNIEEIIYESAYEYFWVYSAFLIFISLHALFVFVFNGLGMSSYPLLLTVISTVLNIALDIITVAVLDMGVLGLALASGVSAFVVDVFALIKLLKVIKGFNLKGQKFQLDFGVKESFIYSFPVMVQQGTIYIASFSISPVINSLGIFAITAYAVVNKIFVFNAQFYQDSSRTLANYVSQCVGGKKYNLIKKGIGVGVLQGIFFAVPVAFLCIFFPNFISGLFIKDTVSDETVSLIVLFCTNFLPFIFFNVINNVFHNLYRGTKKMQLLFLSTLLGSLSRIALSYPLSAHYGMTGIYIAWASSWIIEALMCLIVFISNAWKPAEQKKYERETGTAV